MLKKISVRKTITIPPETIRLDMATFLPAGRYPARIQYELFGGEPMTDDRIRRVRIGIPRFLFEALNIAVDARKGDTLFIDVSGDYRRAGGQWPITDQG